MIACALSGRAWTVPACSCWRKPIGILAETIALTIGALLPITNPFSTAPLFISLTAGFDSKHRTHQARMACLYAFAILVVFLLLGATIVDFFGISVPGIRVAGGLIISVIGFRMLFPQAPMAGAAAQAQQQELDIAFTPIAMPSLAGPGSISVVLTAAAQIKGIRPDDWGVIYIAVIVGMAVTLIICFLVLRMAGAMVRFLGQGGIDAMTRIFGFLLICIGMQFLLTGIGDFFHIPRG
ncbi:MarC family NAAT transporter [Sphingomonas sp. LaA6.9]|uniref:MarC family NAAT transporter n=1 Tax=Sphingomonas sp. LaA6.9 TaxID=2919914 RepID=UPI00247AC1EB|nr:MarC family NAAT transporter [Sphingomonas sp. LaA6.9]